MDTLKQIGRLARPAKDQAIVTVGRLTLYFSYESLIAYRCGDEARFNPVFRKLTATTSKHAGQLGCASFPDAATPEHFARDLRAAMGDA